MAFPVRGYAGQLMVDGGVLEVDVSDSMKDKVVVITGSTQGYGYALAEAMVRQDATVVVSGRSKTALQRALKPLRKLGSATGYMCDVRREHQVYALARRTVEQFGRIDVWINNAGCSTSAGRIIDTPPSQAVHAFMTNALGTLYGARAALHFMLERKDGTLVNIYGAGAFLRPASPTALYGATKAWVASFTRSLAREIAGSGVRLIGYSPGMLLTRMLTEPTALGEPGRAMMGNYASVLRVLAVPPDKAAEKMVRVLKSNRKPFLEYRTVTPWVLLLAVIRIGWENLTRTGKRPTFRLHVADPYRPKI